MEAITESDLLLVLGSACIFQVPNCVKDAAEEEEPKADRTSYHVSSHSPSELSKLS